MTHTVESLVAFEERVAEAFRAKKILAPIHLCSSTQAAPMIEAFADFKPGDWAFGTWRSHFMCLLAGVPEQEVFDAILDGRSMFLQFRKYNVFCSAIVGGILPIALGVAAGIDRDIYRHPDWEDCPLEGSPNIPHPTVWVFVGDMAARTGLFHEFQQYAAGHRLPVRIVIEDNFRSTNAKTEHVWGTLRGSPSVTRYEYSRTFPHVGLSERVSF